MRSKLGTRGEVVDMDLNVNVNVRNLGLRKPET